LEEGNVKSRGTITQLSHFGLARCGAKFPDARVLVTTAKKKTGKRRGFFFLGIWTKKGETEDKGEKSAARGMAAHTISLYQRRTCPTF